MSQTLTIQPGWTPLNVCLMAAGFIVAWPLGLVALAYILWGDRMFVPDQTPTDGQGFSEGGASGWNCCGLVYADQSPSTGNSAFNDYRQRELDRLSAERRRLDDERREFDEFERELKRARDREEFDRFVRGRNDRE